VLQLSANCVRAFQKDQQTLHACASKWPQSCSGNICKRNLICGYASCLKQVSSDPLLSLLPASKFMVGEGALEWVLCVAVMPDTNSGLSLPTMFLIMDTRVEIFGDAFKICD
jgi:hypothetical protein